VKYQDGIPAGVWRSLPHPRDYMGTGLTPVLLLHAPLLPGAGG